MRAALTTAALFASVLALPFAAAPARVQAATPAAGHLRLAIDSSPDFSRLERTARRHRFVVLQAWQTDKLRALKAFNPQAKVLVYKNLSASIASHNRGYRSTGVSYQEADTEHPEWFLLNRAGRRFTFGAYPYLWAMDVGSPGYQRRWADNVIAELQREGWDGVFIDDANTTMRYHYTPSQIAKYPTDAAWQQATRKALAHIGPRVKASGKLAVANIGSWGENPGVGRDWLAFLSGAMDEMFVKWGGRGEGYAHEGRWLDQVRSLEAAQRQGKIFLGVSHSANDDARAARYGWASVLLGADGKAAFALHGDYTHEPWFPEYDYELGAPVAPRKRRPNGLHFRRFARGVVVVNPTDRAREMRLPGKATYTGSGRERVRRIRLAAKRAAILLRDGARPVRIERGRLSVLGGRVVVSGRVAGPPVPAGSKAGPRLRLRLLRGGRAVRTAKVRLRGDGSFAAKVRVCARGRYRVEVVDAKSGRRARWPQVVRVKRPAKGC